VSRCGCDRSFGSGRLPTIALDASGLRSTNYSATVKHNVTTLVVGETPTLDSALKGTAVLATAHLHSSQAAGDLGLVAYDAAGDTLGGPEGGGGGGGASAGMAVMDPSGSGDFVYEIGGLVSGEAYHVRVSAFNGFGNAYGDATYATPNSNLEKHGVR